jgi:hypothetical protein
MSHYYAACPMYASKRHAKVGFIEVGIGDESES